MKRKRTRGMTLVELAIAMGLLTLIGLAVGAAMVSASKSYKMTTQMQNDEYNARLALLAMARDIHRGVMPAASGEAARVSITGSQLSFSTVSGTITYVLSGGQLTRTGNSPVGFAPVELRRFTPEELDGGRRIRLTVECTNGMTLETIISIFRVPGAADTGGGGDAGGP